MRPLSITAVSFDFHLKLVIINEFSWDLGISGASNEDDINFTAKRQHQILMYKGKKRTEGRTHTDVPSLYDECIRVLGENIDGKISCTEADMILCPFSAVFSAIEYTGGVPFEILRPVLDKATPTQLYKIEDFNPVWLPGVCLLDHRALIFVFLSTVFTGEYRLSLGKVSEKGISRYRAGRKRDLQRCLFCKWFTIYFIVFCCRCLKNIL